MTGTPAATVPGMARTPTKAQPTTRPDPEAWRIALDLADGDARRLLVEDDGRRVVVLNEPQVTTA